MRCSLATFLACTTIVGWTACGDDSASGSDAGADAMFVFVDSGPREGGIDASQDAGTDAGRDAGSDAGPPSLDCGPKDLCGDGLDNDCNGLADDRCPCAPGEMQRCYDGPPREAGRGVCGYGMQTCSGGVGTEFGEWGACEGSTHPQPVVCGGGMDYRCDGMIDEGCACTAGDMRDCYTGPTATRGVGACVAGSQICLVGQDGVAYWGDCTGEVAPAPESCDGMDRDCDGIPNGGCECVVGTVRSCYSGPMSTAGVGVCREGSQPCVAGAMGIGAGWGPCTGEHLPEPPACDGVDHECTGTPGVGCACTPGDTRSCYGGTMGTAGVGPCHAGTNTCVSMGGTAGWAADCTGQLLPATETCGNMVDDDCDGMTDEGCFPPPGIMCPADVAVAAGSTVMLTATPTMGPLSNYTWTFVDAPVGGASTARWNPTPPTAASERFTPYIVGVYTIRVSGMNGAGMTTSCDFHVTALPHGFRVQLGWDGSGDIDLHVHGADQRTPWFGTDDCFWHNLAPAFGARLDFDNVTGFGPENVRVDMPAAGAVYWIGVNNYREGAGRIATVQVFCGDTMTTMPTATFTSHALAGRGEGDCSGNEFWYVAKVTFTSATACTVTPIDTYAPSTTACMPAMSMCTPTTPPACNP